MKIDVEVPQALPEEIWVEVAKRLDKTSLVSFQTSCRSFRRLMMEQVQPTLSKGQAWHALEDARLPITSGWFQWAVETVKATQSQAKEAKRILLLAKLAAMHGRLDTIKEILKSQSGALFIFNTTERLTCDPCDGIGCVFKAAASAGKTDVLEWLFMFIRQRPPPKCKLLKSLMASAKEGGHDETCEWLRRQYLCADMNTVEAWDSWNMCPIM